jgi:hypothetical protein
MWQPDKVILNKIESHHTYLAATNYWTPIQSNDNETDNEIKEANDILKTPTNETPKSNKWEKRIARKHEKQMVIDSGATLHFCSEDMDLPEQGKSNKQSISPMVTHFKHQREHPYHSDNSTRKQEKHTCSHTCNNHQ